MVVDGVVYVLVIFVLFFSEFGVFFEIDVGVFFVIELMVDKEGFIS